MARAPSVAAKLKSKASAADQVMPGAQPNNSDTSGKNKDRGGHTSPGEAGHGPFYDDKNPADGKGFPPGLLGGGKGKKAPARGGKAKPTSKNDSKGRDKYGNLSDDEADRDPADHYTPRERQKGMDDAKHPGGPSYVPNPRGKGKGSPTNPSKDRGGKPGPVNPSPRKDPDDLPDWVLHDDEPPYEGSAGHVGGGPQSGSHLGGGVIAFSKKVPARKGKSKLPKTGLATYGSQIK